MVNPISSFYSPSNLAYLVIPTINQVANRRNIINTTYSPKKTGEAVEPVVHSKNTGLEYYVGERLDLVV